jgi:hypothetical protein
MLTRSAAAAREGDDRLLAAAEEWLDLRLGPLQPLDASAQVVD